MNKLNDYGIVSGWYLFELADRAALEKLHNKYPGVKYWLTKHATTKFIRQISATDKLFIDPVVDYDSNSSASFTVNIICNNMTMAIVSISYRAKDHLAVKPYEQPKAKK